MQVRAPMTREVVVAPPGLLLVDAWRILKQQNIRHLPITEAGKLVGIVSDRDFLCAAKLHADGELTFPKKTLAEIMTLKPIVCSPSCSVGEAARIMTSKKIDALPVVSGDHLVGLVTSTDLLLLLLDKAPTIPLPFDFRLMDPDLVQSMD